MVQSGTWRYEKLYKKVQGGTRRYTNREICTYWYVLVRTDPYGLIRVRLPAGFAAAMLLGCIGEQYI